MDEESEGWIEVRMVEPHQSDGRLLELEAEMNVMDGPLRKVGIRY